ncbi:MAG: polysaccharide deacetylase family protein [Sphingomonadales bacterium]|nr:polysaccharide deacetylase family protein [Sphingomonadales bacterium]
MTTILITIDTEYDFGFTRRHGVASRRENFARSIACTTPSGSVGVDYQMDVFDRHGLKAVFFVDPMPALVWGTAAIEDVVGPIVARGHDVQLHIHTEWLELAGGANPLGARTGTNIKDFTWEEQCLLLDHARATLVAAGAPSPVAFRAGNYGANDDTLRALAHLGLAFDTSHCPGIVASLCDISLSAEDRAPMHHCGVTEVPIGCIAAPGGGLRHAQLTALSAGEILAALAHAQRQGVADFTLVSHSFELLSRDRTRINQIVKRRFERLCVALGARGVASGIYRSDPPVAAQRAVPVLPHNPLRMGWRLAEQALSNALYGAG